MKPLTIGRLQLNSPLIQGPLAGYTCAAYRRLPWQYGGVGLTCTEMIACKTVVNEANIAQRFSYIAPDEGPVCFQLSSDDPQELGLACQKVTDWGASMIDLNCGCPVRKIRKKGCGSALLTQPQKLYQLIRAMKHNTSVPVSVKIRVDAGIEVFNDSLIKAIEDAGADCVIVHGRHYSQDYETACHYDQIRYFVENTSLPVIGNGDVADAHTLQMMLATGCDGVMIARAGTGRPWLFQQLLHDWQGYPYDRPSLSQIGEHLFEHMSSLADIEGSELVALRQGRKLAKYYGQYLADTATFCQRFNNCQILTDLDALVKRYFA